ncbi:extracellular solute-binding protein [Candidatus Aerophobetes bacterium]|nr:extracellular solute-binding protein [Candidatus Aerophobetes bacterium]
MIKYKLILVGMGLVFFLSWQSVVAQAQIVFWTFEVDERSLEVQKDLASRFEAKNPDIKVEIVPVDRSLLVEKTITAAATDKLPHVIFHPLDYTFRLVRENIFDSRAASELINELGENSFADGALSLVKYEDEFAAIPVYGWSQILLYRKDLLEKTGLSIPKRWEDIKKAAQALHNPPLLWGFQVPTSPRDIYTQQVLEGFSLSNSARLIDKITGEVNLNTPEFIATLRFYKELSRFTPLGDVNQVHTRIDYLAGRSAMTLWSSFILPDLCALSDKRMLLVEELNKKTGFVGAIKAKDAEAQFGQVSYLGITKEVDKDAVTKDAVGKWIKFILDENYIFWLSVNPEGKLPVRRGTEAEVGKFAEEWKGLLLGEDGRKISDLYDADSLNSILAGVENFDRWGFATGKGFLMSRIYQTKMIPIVLKRYLIQDIFTAEMAASLMNDLVRSLEE